MYAYDTQNDIHFLYTVLSPGCNLPSRMLYKRDKEMVIPKWSEIEINDEKTEILHLLDFAEEKNFP